MSSKKRLDGRKVDELRPMSAKVGVVKQADGSAMFCSGQTIAAVFGPRQVKPSFLQDPEQGLLRCHYNMLAFSGSGDRVRPGPSRRSKEISLVIEKALLPVLDLSSFPHAGVDVFIELLQTDAGTRCAGITAAALALADAGIPMKDLVAAVSVGKAQGQIVADLTKEEEDVADAVDIPVAMSLRTNQVTLLQTDGVVTRKEYSDALALARDACQKVFTVQEAALREKYALEVEHDE